MMINKITSGVIQTLVRDRNSLHFWFRHVVG